MADEEAISLPDGRKLKIGDRVSIDGERGKFLLVALHPSDGSLKFWGGPEGHESWRSFAPDRVKTIHKKKVETRK